MKIERVWEFLVIFNYEQNNYGRSSDRICKSSCEQQGGSLRYPSKKRIFSAKNRVKMLHLRMADESGYWLIKVT